jgi:hypothetical protein
MGSLPPRTTDFNPILEVAREYSSLGLCTIPIQFGSKVFCGNGWKKYQWRRPTPPEIESLFRTNVNIAIVGGAVSDNLVTIDLDYDSPTRVANTLRQFETQGISTWIDQNRPDRAHVHLRTPIPLVTKTRKDLGLELRATGSYTVVPPSVHPSGLTYSFVSRGDLARVELGQLEFLGLELEEAPEPAPSRRIPERTFRLLAGKQDCYPTRSEQEGAIMLGLINAGFDFSEILAIFQRYPGAAIFSESRRGKFQEKLLQNAPAAISWLQQEHKRMMVKAKNDSTAHQQHRAKIREKRNILDGMRWPGRTGITDRKTLKAHLEISQRANSVVYEASVRELSRMTFCSTKTVSKSNRRLIALGYLERITVQPRKTVRKTADRFELKLDAIHEELIKSPLASLDIGMGECCLYEFLSDHELFSSKRLGRSAAELCQLLSSLGPMTTKEIAIQSGRCPNTVRMTMKRLSEIPDGKTGELWSLVELSEGKLWHIADSIDIDELSMALGTTGVRQRMLEIHQEERENYRNS